MIYYDLERKKPIEEGKFKVDENGGVIITEGAFYCFDNSVVIAKGTSIVESYENSRVWAYDNSQVTARDNSQVTANDNSKVTANDNSKVNGLRSK